ncbi:HEPN domain-containing protein [Candidatus Desulfarcum epimagneticum]|uniref:HEPN domain-containing protein n=1 Tax=uncultured Desulfobacteraceae bacterium TaxID=218296 RepID=A0A484HFR2_9BACT|nr:HEPN domain-containing protein [uncultured Desulfobacteraceae bacterium]
MNTILKGAVKQKQIDYWIKSAEHDLDVAETLFQNGKNDWCLFLAHLVLEKMFKAIYVQNIGKTAPRIHDLARMANMAKIELEEDTLEFLDAVNTFNISTRYPDEKLKFYKLCTAEFTKKNFNQIKEIYQCLLQKTGR